MNATDERECGHGISYLDRCIDCHPQTQNEKLDEIIALLKAPNKYSPSKNICLECGIDNNQHLLLCKHSKFHEVATNSL